MKEIGFGIVGTGSIASRFARACAMVPGVCAAGISSRSAENGRKFAAENGVDRVYENPTQMALDPRIDIVYVATPHPFHYENCMAALRAGKPILSEKPMAMTAAQARDIFETAKKSGLFAMEGMWSRFLPNIRQAKAWIEGGRIGRVKLIDGIFSFAVDEKSPKPRLVEAGLGGGAMYARCMIWACIRSKWRRISRWRSHRNGRALPRLTRRAWMRSQY